MRSMLMVGSILVGLSGPAKSCPLAELESILGNVDEHLFWAEFWDDKDTAEALRERERALAEVRLLIDASRGPRCAEDPVAASLVRLGRRVEAAEARNVTPTSDRR